MLRILKHPLKLPLDHRTTLLTMETVRAVRHADADEVLAELDSGQWRWVWDVAVHQGQKRDLRFLARELIAPGACDFPIAEAVELVMGTRPRFRSSEVGQLLFVSRPTMMRLFDTGELSFKYNARRWVSRPSLAAFLTRRLAGGVR